MADTPTNRGYGWALQTDYTTKKPISAGNFRRMIVTDQNFLDSEALTQNDEDWSHGQNSATDEWIQAHDARISHSMPGFAQELGRIFILNLGTYAVTTPGGGTNSRTHSFKPTDPNTTRQDKAVSYLEKLAEGWNVQMCDAVSDGFTLKGSEVGVLNCDFNLLGSGLVIPDSGAVWTGGSPTVVMPTGLHKLFNTQVSLDVDDDGTNTSYGCRYHAFEVAFKKTMLGDAGFKPGCARYLVDGDPTSGLIRSAYEFDKQMLDFTLEVSMGSGSPEFEAVQDQRPLSVTIVAEGGVIESTITHKLEVIIPVAKYKTSKPAISQGVARFQITGKALFDFASSKLFEVKLTTDVTSFATGW